MKYHFGNYYAGKTFDIDDIEACIEEFTDKYLNAVKDDKLKGIEVEYKNEVVNWQQESIVFPFLPKKNIKGFIGKDKEKGISGTNCCGVFLSK